MLEVSSPHEPSLSPLNLPSAGPVSTEPAFTSVSRLLKSMSMGRLKALDVVTGGTTNQMLLCTLIDGRQVLLRLFGEASADFIDRGREALFFEAVAARGLGPRLLGSFANGRIEEYISAPPLTAAQLRSPAISLAIARKVKEFHCLEGIPGLDCTEAILFPQLRSWHRLAVAACGKSHAGYNIEQLGHDIDRLEARLSMVPSPLCPSHNDVNHLNILLRDDGSITLIDLEYASCNHRGFDLGNHFCEWATDFQTSEPHKMDFSKYPTDVQQREFCREYLSHLSSRGGRWGGGEDASAGVVISEEEVESLRHEANEYALASHLQWGIWALVQSKRSSIGFDFISYARQRLHQFHVGMMTTATATR